GGRGDAVIEIEAEILPRRRRGLTGLRVDGAEVDVAHGEPARGAAGRDDVRARGGLGVDRGAVAGRARGGAAADEGEGERDEDRRAKEKLGHARGLCEARAEWKYQSFSPGNQALSLRPRERPLTSVAPSTRSHDRHEPQAHVRAGVR